MRRPRISTMKAKYRYIAYTAGAVAAVILGTIIF